MNKTDPRYEPFDRRPPAELKADDPPLDEVQRYMRLTHSIFDAFGWQAHPIGAWGLLRWSATAPNGGIYSRTFAETYDDGARVYLFVSDQDDCDDGPCETFENDLALFCRLVEVHRTREIGRIDLDKLISAIRNLALVASGHEAGSMPLEVWATLANGFMTGGAMALNKSKD